jgi:endonuclease/exonuclease/phosphatase family metal-dependent hydrolase
MHRLPLLSSLLVLSMLAACGDSFAPADVSGDVGSQVDALAGQVIINEVLANEPGSDINGEFVELVNTTTASISLSGWTISDSTGVRHTFPSTASVGAGKAVVVFGGAAGIPSGLTGASAASTGTLGLGNSGDTVTLKDNTGATVDTVTYSSTLASTDAVSANRSPDANVSTTTYVLHTTLSSTRTSSPGKRVDGTDFGGTTGGTDGGTGGTDGGTGGGTGVTHIRIAAANTTSGNYQSYDPGEGVRMFKGTKPDVVLIQEFNYGTNSATDIRSFVDQTFGPSFAYYRQPSVQIPNGVISRWPIIAAGVWDDTLVSNRDFVWARIDIPGAKDLWAVSLHLLTSDATTRANEASALVNFIKANVPAGDYLVVGGDLNTGSRVETCINTLSQVVVTASPYPADQNGNTNTNASRARPYDWVLVDADLNQYKTATVLGGSRSYPAGLVLDSRVYTPLTEISPVLYGDSSAFNMQHMEVVRDFNVPY